MEHFIPWFTLKSVPGIGNLTFRRLVEHLGSPEGVLRAPAKDLAQVAGMTQRLVTAIQCQKTPQWVATELKRIEKNGYKLVTLHDPLYPELLQHIPDPPPLLYLNGHIEPTAAHIAIVGSRKATSYGRTTTRRLARQLGNHGIVVVSGMARGIDTEAHRGALEAGGPTIAVLGSGLKRIYPAQNRELFNHISQNGAVVSEFNLDAEPEPHHFPQRNRVISGISLGTVVVEAAIRSGSLITARLAAEQGREVFAVPGSIHAATAHGTHALIKQGAKLVETAEDILEEVQPHLAMPSPLSHGTATLPPLSTEESEILEAIGPYPLHIDELARQLPQDIGQLSAALMQLELKGVICQEPGRYYLRQKAFPAVPPAPKK